MRISRFMSGVALAMALAAGSLSSAEAVTFDVSGHWNPSPTLSGTLDIDVTAGVVTGVDLVVSGVSQHFTILQYANYSSSFNVTSLGFITQNIIAPNSYYELDIQFYGTLAGFTGVNNIASAQAAYYQYDIFFSLPGSPFWDWHQVAQGSFSGSITPEVTTTPLPAALPLFATGLGGLGLLGWRRKRKNAAVASVAARYFRGRKMFRLALQLVLTAGLSVITGVVLTTSQCNAVTYTYTSNPDVVYDTNNYLTAAVDLNCVGVCAPGTYVLGVGLQSYEITAHDNSGGILNSANSSSAATTAPSQTYTNYLTLDASGHVTNWFLYLITTSFNEFWTIGQTVLWNQDYAEGPVGGTSGGILLYSSPPGTWTTTTAATPLPAALPLFATGLGALGLLGWRRKRKNAATQPPDQNT